MGIHNPIAYGRCHWTWSVRIGVQTLGMWKPCLPLSCATFSPPMFLKLLTCCRNKISCPKGSLPHSKGMGFEFCPSCFLLLEISPGVWVVFRLDFLARKSHRHWVELHVASSPGIQSLGISLVLTSVKRHPQVAHQPCISGFINLSLLHLGFH